MDQCILNLLCIRLKSVKGNDNLKSNLVYFPQMIFKLVFVIRKENALWCVHIVLFLEIIKISRHLQLSCPFMYLLMVHYIITLKSCKILHVICMIPSHTCIPSSVSHLWIRQWGLWHKRQISLAWISNYIPLYSVGCDYSSVLSKSSFTSMIGFTYLSFTSVKKGLIFLKINFTRFI